MNIKSNIQLLAEAAATDLQINTQAAVELDSIKESYNSIPTAEGYCVTEAADVVVNKIGNDYYVEMVNLSPFMLDSGITTIAKALNLVAEANGLPAKSVGLVIDSQESVNNMLASSDARAKSTGNAKIRENAVAKIQKNIAIANKLMTEGYKVTKKGDKKDKNSVCPECGKAKCKCKCEDDKKKSAKDECGGSCGKGAKKECDAPGSTSGKAVISEKKECGAGCKKTNEANVEFDSIGAISAITEAFYGGVDLESITEAELVSLVESQASEARSYFEKKLKDVEKKPDGGDIIVHVFLDWLKSVFSQGAAFGVAKAVATTGLKHALATGSKAGAAALVGGGVVMGTLPLISLVTHIALICCTRVFRVEGSISDKKVKCNKMLKALKGELSRYEKSGNEKMANKAKESIKHVEAKIAELEKKYKGKSTLYQNIHAESVQF